jgi:xanthine/uracil permease
MIFQIKWWQLIFYEMAVMSLGIIIGAYWNSFFSNYLYLFLFLFAVCGGYTLNFLTNQVDFKDEKGQDK